MLDNREMKKILVVILAILVLLGIFIGIRSCDKDEKELPKEIEEKEDEKEEVIPKEETKEEQVIIEEKIEKGIQEEEPVVVETTPAISLPTNLTVALNGQYNLPVITKDDNGVAVTTRVTIDYLPFGSDQYQRVDKVDTTKLGLYKVTYIVSNGSKSVSKTMIIEIVDNEAPVVSAYTFKDILDQNGGKIGEEQVNVADESIIDGNVYFDFSDNDQVVYAEYYEALRETVNGEITDTIEKNSMANVVPIDLSNQFVLTADGEYFVRVEDRSGNVTEFHVTIDTSNPVIDNQFVIQIGDQLTAMLVFKENIVSADDWTIYKNIASKEFNGQETGTILNVKDLYGHSATANYTVYTILNVKNDGTDISNGDVIDSADLSKVVLNINNTGIDPKLTINGEEVTIATEINLQPYIKDDKCDIEYHDGKGNFATYSFTVTPIVP